MGAKAYSFGHGALGYRLLLGGACATFLLACSDTNEPGTDATGNAASTGTIGGVTSGGTTSGGTTSAVATSNASQASANVTSSASTGMGNSSSISNSIGMSSAGTESATTGESTSGGGATGNVSSAMSSGGAGGGSSAGGTGMGGSGGSTMSSGCGADTWPSSDRYSIDSSGTTREYVLDMPTDYDTNQAYRLVFTWHWRGGNANDVVNGAGEASRGPYYGLKSRSNGSAIFVSPEGLVDNGVSGWANPGGRDIQFLRDMLDQLNAELCIDQDRIFSTGFSYGGMMSFAVGCAMGGVVRAIAPMAGALISGCEDGDAPVAFWGSHAPGDSVVGIDLGRQGRDEFLQRNGCDTATMPTQPGGCVAYQGCESGYPVTWCEFSGDHYTPDFAPDATWEFFSQF